MGLRRVMRVLGLAVVVMIVAAVAYALVGLIIALIPGVENATVRAMPWPQFLPTWPVLILLVGAVAATCVYIPLMMVERARKRKLVQALGAEASAWPEGPAARAAEVAGLKLTRVGGFRAHARTPHVVELSWNPPLDAVDEVVVYRSTTGFATSPEPGDDQVTLCRAVEAVHVDADLEDERVYYYTAFAHGRDGSWSSPSWAWAATPQLPLHTKVLGSLRIARVGMFDGGD